MTVVFALLQTALLRTTLLWLGLAASAWANPLDLKLTGRVVDSAQMLSASTESRITALLEAHARATSNQIVVVTLNSLQGDAIESIGYQLGRKWGIGQKDKNNGALLIIAKTERKIRIEVGYGLEGELTDAISSNIIYSVIRPRFRTGDFDGGIEAGVSAMIQALGGQYQMQEVRQSEDRPASFWVIFFMIVVMMLLSHFGRRSGFLPDVSSGRGRGGHGGFGGGGFGGGGFRGGGGGFGGGGASGGW